MTAGIIIEKCTTSILLSIAQKFISAVARINLPTHSTHSIAIEVPTDNIILSSISNSLKSFQNRNNSAKYRNAVIMIFNRCFFMPSGILAIMDFNSSPIRLILKVWQPQIKQIFPNGFSLVRFRSGS